ncbi:hypothetical protein MKX08_009737 [Trichoderma sp. CBMAI-0020]|nr:hypothetical protein MKX08_009737 [Trichoderma sp. CBMAI-0020]
MANTHDAARLESATNLLDALKIGDSPTPTLIDTTADMAKMIDSLKGLPTSPPSLYIDLEGVHLSRHGTISILQMYIHPLGRTYLVDVLTLKEESFSTCGESGLSLKDILESRAIPKVFFDVRNDSDALHHHFQIKLAGILDLQLMEIATRNAPGRYVTGLAKCIERDAPLSHSERRNWMQIKDRGQRLFRPEDGGSYQVFNERPLQRDIGLYCAQDVQILPRLWAHYRRKITHSWMQKVIRVSEKRVEESQSPGYTPHGRHKALAPTRWY